MGQCLPCVEVRVPDARVERSESRGGGAVLDVQAMILGEDQDLLNTLFGPSGRTIHGTPRRRLKQADSGILVLDDLWKGGKRGAAASRPCEAT